MKSILCNKILGISIGFILPLMCCVSCLSFEPKNKDFLTHDDELWAKGWHSRGRLVFIESKTKDLDTLMIDRIYIRSSFKLVDNVEEVIPEKRYKKGEMYINFRILHDGIFYEGLFKKEGGGRLKDKLELYINGEPFRRTVIKANKKNREFANDSNEDILKFINDNNNSNGIDYIIITDSDPVIKFSINGRIYNFNSLIKYDRD